MREIVWTGKLLDKHYDEFVFRAYLTDGLKPDTTLYFPAVQECEKAQSTAGSRSRPRARARMTTSPRRPA